MRRVTTFLVSAMEGGEECPGRKEEKRKRPLCEPREALYYIYTMDAFDIMYLQSVLASSV